MNCLRPHTKCAVAQLYYPDDTARTAVKKFHAEIQQTPALLKALLAAGYNPRSKKRIFSPRQLQLIVKHLGQP